MRNASLKMKQFLRSTTVKYASATTSPPIGSCSQDIGYPWHVIFTFGGE